MFIDVAAVPAGKASDTFGKWQIEKNLVAVTIEPIINKTASIPPGVYMVEEIYNPVKKSLALAIVVNNKPYFFDPHNSETSGYMMAPAGPHTHFYNNAYKVLSPVLFKALKSGQAVTVQFLHA